MNSGSELLAAAQLLCLDRPYHYPDQPPLLDTARKYFHRMPKALLGDGTQKKVLLSFCILQGDKGSHNLEAMREGADARVEAHLCPDVVKDGQQYRVKDPGPEWRCEGCAVILQCVKENLQ